MNIDYRVISKYKFMNPTLIEHNNENIQYYGKWYEESYNLNNKFKYSAVSYDEGDTVTFNFRGKHLSMMNLLSRDSGRLVCQLDEKYGFYIDLFMESDCYFNTTINLNNLENTEHTLTMVIDKERNPKSTGSKVVIGGFLIDLGNKV